MFKREFCYDGVVHATFKRTIIDNMEGTFLRKKPQLSKDARAARAMRDRDYPRVRNFLLFRIWEIERSIHRKWTVKQYHLHQTTKKVNSIIPNCSLYKHLEEKVVIILTINNCYIGRIQIRLSQLWSFQSLKCLQRKFKWSQ